MRQRGNEFRTIPRSRFELQKRSVSANPGVVQLVARISSSELTQVSSPNENSGFHLREKWPTLHSVG